MVRDLKFGIKVIICPIIREKDGLALSSRNIYLSFTERLDALVLNKSLKLAEKKIGDGEKDTERILTEMKTFIGSVKSSSLDYVSIVEKKTFSQVNKLKAGEKYYILVACKIGKTRLIDNLIVKA